MPEDPNLLDLVPHRGEVTTEYVDGKCRLCIPRFRSRPGRAFGRLLRKSENIAINMDAFGTTVWESIDGAATVREIGQRLRAAHGEAAEPLYPRLREFLGIKERNGLIRYSR